MKLIIPNGYYTVTQAARIVGLSNNCMNFHIKQGHIEIIDVNKGRTNYYRLISQAALDTFMKKREPDVTEEHLYEIICINMGQVSVIFKTTDLMKLCQTYTRMIERDNKLVRIRIDGVPLTICESDRLGYTFHPRMKTKAREQYVKKMGRSTTGPERDLSRHDQGCVQHGKESGVLRCGACGSGQAHCRRDRAKEREPEEPAADVPACERGSVQKDPAPAEREEHPGVSSRSCPGGSKPTVTFVRKGGEWVSPEARAAYQASMLRNCAPDGSCERCPLNDYVGVCTEKLHRDSAEMLEDQQAIIKALSDKVAEMTAKIVQLRDKYSGGDHEPEETD